VAKKVNALKARQNLGHLLEDVYRKGSRYVIQRAGQPMAAVVPLWFLKEYEERRRRLFATIRRIHKRNKATRPEVVERDVAEAVRAVRKKASR